MREIEDGERGLICGRGWRGNLSQRVDPISESAGTDDAERAKFKLLASFGMNPICLSRFFREKTGETLLEYIVRSRIEKAKHYLEQGCSIYSTATEVGCNNYKTLHPGIQKIRGRDAGQVSARGRRFVSIWRRKYGSADFLFIRRSVCYTESCNIYFYRRIWQ